MWYFSWILGVTLACTVAILNGIWFELRGGKERAEIEKEFE